MSRLTDDQQQLVEQYLPCAAKLAGKFWRSTGQRFPFEEVQAEAKVALCKAAAVYDPARATFTTMLYTIIPRWLVQVFLPRKKTIRAANDSDGLFTDFAPGRELDPADQAADADEQANAVKAVGQIRRRLTDRQFAVLEMREMEGQTLAEVGKRLGLTRERARQIQVSAVKRAKGAMA